MTLLNLDNSSNMTKYEDKPCSTCLKPIQGTRKSDFGGPLIHNTYVHSRLTLKDSLGLGECNPT